MVAGDNKQVVFEIADVDQGFPAGPYLEEDILDNVFGQLVGFCNVADVGVEEIGIAMEKLPECLFIACGDELEEVIGDIRSVC